MPAHAAAGASEASSTVRIARFEPAVATGKASTKNGTARPSGELCAEPRALVAAEAIQRDQLGRRRRRR